MWYTIVMNITPEVGVLLIQLPPSKHGSMTTVSQSANYKDAPTFGFVLGINSRDPENKHRLNKTVYFRLFKDDCEVSDGTNRKLALIEAKDIMGMSDAPNTQS